MELSFCSLFKYVLLDRTATKHTVCFYCFLHMCVTKFGGFLIFFSFIYIYIFFYIISLPWYCDAVIDSGEWTKQSSLDGHHNNQLMCGFCCLSNSWNHWLLGSRQPAHTISLITRMQANISFIATKEKEAIDLVGVGILPLNLWLPCSTAGGLVGELTI